MKVAIIEDFKNRQNRFSQYVTREQQLKRYHDVLADMERRYGTGEYHTDFDGNTLLRHDTAMWFALNDY